MKRLILTLPLILVACGTPQEQCIARNTRDLRTVEGLISEAEGNLARGYALVKEQIVFPSFEPCYQPGRATPDNPNPPPVLTTCRTRSYHTVTKPQAIDLEAEARKLAQLKEKRRALARAAEPVIAQCRAAYPE
jgi:hypothetical protein